MNYDPKHKKITSLILIIVAISLICTALILMNLVANANSQTEDYWFFQESRETGAPIVLENAYILSNDDGYLEFMYDFCTYIVEGNLEEEFQGVANITIDGDKVSKISIKPNYIRVIIKNGSSIFYDNLYVKKLSDNTIISVNETMRAQNISSMEITDSMGLSLSDSNGNVKGNAYEGCFRIIKTEDGFVLINELPMETYVKYVLPSEMPIYFGREALKAQAVCARTYAYAQMKNTSYACYAANLDDSTDFQAYNNAGRYIETDTAVEETKGQVITCDGELINCYYYSTSPGVTNDLSSWGIEDTAYISCAGIENANGLNLAVASDFSQFINSHEQCYDSASAFYRWDATLDISSVKESAKGALQSISILERNQAGYITEIELKYENTTEILKNENEIRRVLGKYLTETCLNNGDVRTNLSMIPSACFEIAEVSDGKVVLRGGGFGHGIGMSQYGAKAMAEEGYNYLDIIQYYYESVEIPLEFY